MLKLPPSLLLLTSLVATGCPQDPGGGGGELSEPILGEWTVVGEATFPQEGETAVTELLVGTNLDDNLTNFRNRGDITFDFSGSPGTIKLEMQAFTSATVSGTDDALAKLHPWAFAGSFAGSPADNEAAGNPACYTDVWPDGCNVSVYFDGVDQDRRSGANFRLTLPSDYAGKVTGVTQDNEASDDYPSRGDIVVSGLYGSGEFVVESGNIDIKLADNAVPAPTCAPADLAACESNGWDKDECGCYEQLGGLQAESYKGFASNITIDIPDSLWAAILVSNDDSASQLGCTATVDCDALGGCTEDKFEGDDKRASVSVGLPSGENFLEAAGYSIGASAKLCQNVDFVNEPGDEPELELRGFVEVCSGCL